MKYLLLLPLLGALAACEKPPVGVVEKVATAPDGTVLWSVLPCNAYNCQYVYFSTSGTQHEVRDGKVFRSMRVPNEASAP